MNKSLFQTLVIFGTCFPMALAAAAPNQPLTKGLDSASWDWTVEGKWPIYFHTNELPPPSVSLVNAANPFFQTGQALSVAKEMYPEDGWMLVYRDFGSPADAGPVPSFALYNRFNGKLRALVSG